MQDALLAAVTMHTILPLWNFPDVIVGCYCSLRTNVLDTMHLCRESGEWHVMALSVDLILGCRV